MKAAPHKHAAAIAAWAAGEPCQFRTSGTTGPGPWYDLSPPAAGRGHPAFTWDWEYRIKPEVVEFRTLLWRPTSTGRLCVLVVTREEQAREPREQWSGFIHWISDWQEVEL